MVKTEGTTEKRDWADKWFLSDLLPTWEKQLVAEGLEITIEVAEDLARRGALPISEVAAFCSEGRERQQVAERFDFAGKSVLEIGCGRGYYTQFLAKEAIKVAALDKMLAGRRKHMWDDFRKILEGQGWWHKVVPIQADARAIPLPDDSFDVGTCAGGFFRDLYPDGCQQAVLSELKRVCKELMLAIYVNYQLNEAQKTYIHQLELRRDALERGGASEENKMHLPFKPVKVKEWLEGIGIKAIDFLTIDLNASWAMDVQHLIQRIDDKNVKTNLLKRLTQLNRRIDQHGCKRPPIMLIWA